MAKYVSTGKFNFPKTIPGFLFGIAMAVLYGLLYGWAMELIPFIIVDLLVLLGIIALLIVTAVGIVRMGVIRNNVVKVLVVLTICVVAWYSQWVYTTRNDFWQSLLKFERVFDEILDYASTHELMISKGLSSSGAGLSGIALMILYALELVIFLLPTILVFKFQKEYFCESCGAFNENKTFYVSGMDENKLPAAEQSGDFRFLSELNRFYVEPAASGVIGQTAWKVEFSHCPKCQQNGIIDMARGRWKADKKGKISFSQDNKILSRVLVNNITTPVLLGNIPK